MDTAMSQQRKPQPESGLGGLGGVLMGATRAGQNVNRNLARPRYTPVPQLQSRPQIQAQQQARSKYHAQQQTRAQAQPQPYYQASPVEIFNFRMSLATGKRVPLNLPSRKI
jgi:hypothetical protein